MAVCGVPEAAATFFFSPQAAQPATDPVTMRHLVSTIMHTLFDVGEVRVTRGVPDDVGRVITGGEPIQALHG